MAGNPFGAGTLGMARLGDERMSKSRAYGNGLGLTYTVVASKYAQALALSYRVQAANTQPLLLYYLITPPTNFAINGDASIIAPDQVTYTPRPVVAHTLLAGPILQGYKTMSWAYTELQEPEFGHLLSFYNPQNPTVTLIYPDETGTWVQRQAQMLPPVHGHRETVRVLGVILSFTGLLA